MAGERPAACTLRFVRWDESEERDAARGGGVICREVDGKRCRGRRVEGRSGGLLGGWMRSLGNRDLRVCLRMGDDCFAVYSLIAVL